MQSSCQKSQTRKLQGNVAGDLEKLQSNPETEGNLDAVNKGVKGKLPRSEIFDDPVCFFHGFESFHRVLPVFDPLV
jgi:hypothetical protein